MPQHVLATTVVGSYPQPDWLVDRSMLSKGVPRVRLQGMWRIPEPLLEPRRHLSDAIGLLGEPLEQPELDLERDELLLRSVVEVALDPAALMVLRLDQPAARRPQLLDVGLELRREPDVAEDKARLGGQVLQELVLRRFRLR